jgi:hypothetical protein
MKTEIKKFKSKEIIIKMVMRNLKSISTNKIKKWIMMNIGTKKTIITKTKTSNI